MHVPKVYWTYTRARVLTLEWLDGTQLADVDLLPLTVEERRDLAYGVAETWMTMIFRHGFFHADPHPANIFIVGQQIALIDFGTVGYLSEQLKDQLVDLLVALVRNDVEGLVLSLTRLGGSARVDELALRRDVQRFMLRY